jgi:hypothetical protein
LPVGPKVIAEYADRTPVKVSRRHTYPVHLPTAPSGNINILLAAYIGHRPIVEGHSLWGRFEGDAAMLGLFSCPSGLPFKNIPP